METTTHHGRETAYRTAGDGARTLLFVHGSGGSHRVWKSQFRLTDEYTVVALDLSGHGESADIDADPGYTTLTAYASDVMAVASAVDADVVVGNSLGGAVCLHAILERGFDPDGLVLAGSGAKLSVLQDLLNWLDTDFERAVEFLHEPGHLFADAPQALVDASREMMRTCGQRVTRRDFLTAHRFDVRDELGDVDPPTLAVVGDDDRLTPPTFHEYLRDELPNGRLTIIDDAGHLAMLEKPAAFNGELRSFVTSLDSRT